MPDAPQVKASVLQSEVQAVDTLAEDDARRIRAALSTGLTRQIDEATRVDWLPAEMHAQLADAVLAVLGPERAHVFWRRQRHRSLQAPIIMGMLRTALSVFGFSPHRLLGVLPRAYASVNRNAGSVHAEEAGARESRIHYRDVPAVLLGSAGWRLRAVTAYEALLEYLRLKNEVEMTEHDVSRGTAVIAIRWQPRD